MENQEYWEGNENPLPDTFITLSVDEVLTMEKINKIGELFKERFSAGILQGISLAEGAVPWRLPIGKNFSDSHKLAGETYNNLRQTILDNLKKIKEGIKCEKQ